MHSVENRQLIINNITQYGCHVVLIEESDYLPGFVYSIGLYEKFGQPEIICFGLPTDVAHSLINHACDLIKEGQTLQDNTQYSGFLEGYTIQLLPVDKDYYPYYVGYAGWYYTNFDFPVQQLVWPDKQRLFPWEQGFNPDWQLKQPLLDRNTDFKFYEKRNLAVFTTREAFDGDPILYVYHDADGYWQFHTSANPDLGNSMIVSLESMLKLDPSLNELFTLEYGQNAYRQTKDDEWIIEDAPEEE